MTEKKTEKVYGTMAEMFRERETVMKTIGPVIFPNYDLFENPYSYPKDKLVRLRRLSKQLQAVVSAEAIEEYQALAAEIRSERFPDAPEPVWLWKDGNMPADPDYTDNSKYIFNHNPDYRPFLYSRLLPEDITPKGAVIFSSGGGHGEACLSGLQISQELNDLGYQAFHVMNRPNKNPWVSSIAAWDVGRGIRYIRAHAEEFRISPDKVAFAGFSNGGLTGEQVIQYCSGTRQIQDIYPDYVPDELDDYSAAPDAFLCIYGPRFINRDISPEFDWNNVVYPPTFLALGEADFNIPNVHPYITDLREHNVPVEVHTFVGVPHGLGGAAIEGEPLQYPAFQQWLPLADAFLDYVYSHR